MYREGRGLTKYSTAKPQYTVQCTGKRMIFNRSAKAQERSLTQQVSPRFLPFLVLTS